MVETAGVLLGQSVAVAVDEAALALNAQHSHFLLAAITSFAVHLFWSLFLLHGLLFLLLDHFLALGQERALGVDAFLSE